MIRRILAPNPSMYTGPGTNTYVIVSDGEALVLDPGPVIEQHMLEIITQVSDLTPVGVVVTHTHPDHAPMANPLASRLDVPVYGYESGPQFDPDVLVADGGSIVFGSDSITAVHTPGHTPDHLCFLHSDTLFTGDHIMGGSTVIIEDAAEYLNSLYLVRDLEVARLEPGHGDAMDDAAAVITQYIDHRLEREVEIVAAVTNGARSVGEIVDIVYAGLPSGLRHAAVHQVGVQLVKLNREGAIWFDLESAGERSQVRPR
ncbi:MAG: MBL fold metallo-hydrolase [Acidimicrobiia bacterium]|nr:MAG: MBL fold metallo-hydrolase [Acidimicrobiia bacterium]